jgi:hypothetical protein
MLSDALELLDRQVSLLLRQRGRDFFLHLPMFVRALETDPRLSAVIQDVWLQAEFDLKAINTRRAEVNALLVAVREQFVHAFPDANDCNAAKADRGDPGWRAYEYSIALFDDLAERSKDDHWPDRRSIDDARDVLQYMSAILSYKLDSVDPEASNSAVDPLRRALGNASRRFEHLQREYHLSTMASGTVATVRVLVRAASMNPDPAVVTAPLSFDEVFRNGFSEIYGAGGIVRRYAYERRVDESTVAEARRIALSVRHDVRRFHEEVRRRLGLARSLRGVFQRYAARAAWHEAEALRELARTSRGAEDALTADLARYLHDQGFNPLTKPWTGRFEPDLLQVAMPHWSFYVEAKQYEDLNPRAYLIRGMYQVWDTLGEIRGTPFEVREGFYVVFRRGGPRVTLPDELRVDGVTVYPLLVDIAPAAMSGSRQRHQPVELTVDELCPAKPLPQ